MLTVIASPRQFMAMAFKQEVGAAAVRIEELGNREDNSIVALMTGFDIFLLFCYLK